jgi:hypothetical protein
VAAHLLGSHRATALLAALYRSRGLRSGPAALPDFGNPTTAGRADPDIEPHSQIGHSFTFRGFGLRLVVTKSPSGIDVTGASSLIDRLAREFGATPHKNA